MGYRCCVPNCHGNYVNGPKVSVFSFPKNKTLHRRLIQVIHSKDFKPTHSSTVYERHLNSCDIIQKVEAYNENGEKLQASLHRIKLKEGAIPTVLPNCVYFSAENLSRKVLKKEENAVEIQIYKTV